MLHVLLAVVAAGPKQGSTWSMELHHEERLKVATKGQQVDDVTDLNAKAKIRVESVKGDRPDVVNIETPKHEFPAVTVREDSGAPVLTWKEPVYPGHQKLLKAVLGRLVLEDPERAAMLKCSPETQPATQRWLQNAIARLNSSEPGEVTIEDLTLKCKAPKLEVAFKAKVPRATLLIELEVKGTLTADPKVWFTQWKLSGPVEVKSENLNVTGTFSSQLSGSR